MSTNINIGDQNVMFSYKKVLNSKDFSGIFKNLFPVGIYEGLIIDSYGSSSVNVTKGSLVLKDKDDSNLYIKVNFGSDFTVAGNSESNNICVVYFDYIYNDNNNVYAKIEFVSDKSGMGNVIEIGRLVYNSGVPVGVDYSYRDDGKVNFRNFYEIYSKTEGDGRYLQVSNNLNDLNNVATARTNLDVYSKTEGDGRYLRISNNLSDIPDKAIARSNLNVYSKTEGDTRYLTRNNNLSDLANKTTARSNLEVKLSKVYSDSGWVNITVDKWYMLTYGSRGEMNTRIEIYVRDKDSPSSYRQVDIDNDLIYICYSKYTNGDLCIYFDTAPIIRHPFGSNVTADQFRLLVYEN